MGGDVTKMIVKNIIKNILKITVSSLFLFTAFSCTNSYDEMIDSFNRKYFLPESSEDEKYSAISPNFNPYKMLEKEYSFRADYYINLEGPKDASSYLWSYSEVKTEEDKAIVGNIDETFTNICTEKDLYFKTSDFFKVGHVYKLVLTITVTGAEGTVREYIDTATISIIDQ